MRTFFLIILNLPSYLELCTHLGLCCCKFNCGAIYFNIENSPFVRRSKPFYVNELYPYLYHNARDNFVIQTSFFLELLVSFFLSVFLSRLFMKILFFDYELLVFPCSLQMVSTWPLVMPLLMRSDATNFPYKYKYQ